MGLKVVDDSHKYTIVRVAQIPGAGGAFHDYTIEAKQADGTPGRVLQTIHFQEGPILEAGVNGIMMEDLLAININRLEGFQSGPYACPANQDALEHCRQALAALKGRTKAREEQGIEGTSKIGQESLAGQEPLAPVEEAEPGVAPGE